PGTGYITQAAADGRYLQLTGGTLATPGNLTVGGAFVGSSTGSFASALTTHGITDIGGPINTSGTYIQITPGAGSIARFISATPTQTWSAGQNGGTGWQIDNITGGVTPFAIATSGLLTLTSGLTVSSGTTTTQALSAQAISGTTGTFSGAVSGTTGTFSSNV